MHALVCIVYPCTFDLVFFIYSFIHSVFYLQVGQRHGGIMGIIQVACSLAQEHIWFERKIASDRRMVASR